MLRPDETWHRLLGWTAGQAPSERLAAQILAEEGYRDIDPIHPLGGRDGGKDARVTKDGRPWIMAVHFPRDRQRLTQIKKKFVGDFAGVAANEVDGMAFVTNQELREAERRELERIVDGEVDIFHLERVVAILDRPRMAGVREQYLGIPALRAAPLDPADRLAELERASLARCASKWQAAGLSRADAIELAENSAVGRPDPSLLPSEAEPVVVWTAPMGSGKSIAAERFHQDSIEIAQLDPEAPVPVFLGATTSLPDLMEAAASNATEVGEPRRQGADVIVDGLDELGFEAAELLLDQARVLAGTWPKTRVLLVSRPMSSLDGIEENRRLPRLSDQEAHHTVELAAGREVRTAELATLPNPLRNLIRQPLFALLAGGWMRENGSLPRAPIDFFAQLGRRASAELRIEESRLRSVAVLSVRHDLGEVAPAEVADIEETERLISTGLVERRGSGLVFTLPALAQWFAARALSMGEVGIEELLAEPRELDLWRYPLALSIVLGDSTHAMEVLRPLLERNPGFAFRLLDTISSNAILDGATPPPWREGGEQIRAALQAMVDGLGPTGPLVADTDGEGRLAPLAVHSDKRHLWIASYIGDEDRPDVFPLPSDFDLWSADGRWGHVRMAVCGPGPAWAWEWVRKGVRDRLEKTVKERLFPIAPDGPLADETAWAFACALMDRSTLMTEAIPLDDLIEEVEKFFSHEETGSRIFYAGAGATYNLNAILAYLRRRKEEGIEVLRAPLPPPDRREGGGWIGDFYSEERLVEVTETIYEQALVAYRQLVERWMPTLAPRLEHYALLPVRVVGFLNSGRDREGFPGPIPHMSGYLEALPEDAESEVAIQVGDTENVLANATEVWRAQQAARPQAARWLSGTVGGMKIEVGGRSPVADVVYEWLAHDLKLLGLVGPLAGHTRSGARTLWEG